jgi:hypothetical protein
MTDNYLISGIYLGIRPPLGTVAPTKDFGTHLGFWHPLNILAPTWVLAPTWDFGTHLSFAGNLR